MNERIAKARVYINKRIEWKQARIKAFAGVIEENTKVMNKHIENGDYITALGYADSIKRTADDIKVLGDEIKALQEQLGVIDYIELEEE